MRDAAEQNVEKKESPKFIGLDDKVEAALAVLEETDSLEIDVTLSFSELRLIRKYLLVDRYENDLAAENLKAGSALSKRRKAKKPLDS